MSSLRHFSGALFSDEFGAQEKITRNIHNAIALISPPFDPTKKKNPIPKSKHSPALNRRGKPTLHSTNEMVEKEK